MHGNRRFHISGLPALIAAAFVGLNRLDGRTSKLEDTVSVIQKEFKSMGTQVAALVGVVGDLTQAVNDHDTLIEQKLDIIANGDADDPEVTQAIQDIRTNIANLKQVTTDVNNATGAVQSSSANASTSTSSAAPGATTTNAVTGNTPTDAAPSVAATTTLPGDTISSPAVGDTALDGTAGAQALVSKTSDNNAGAVLPGTPVAGSSPSAPTPVVPGIHADDSAV